MHDTEVHTTLRYTKLGGAVHLSADQVLLHLEREQRNAEKRCLQGSQHGRLALVTPQRPQGKQGEARAAHTSQPLTCTAIRFNAPLYSAPKPSS